MQGAGLTGWGDVWGVGEVMGKLSGRIAGENPLLYRA
jgi:hypothetical protein